MWSSIHQAALTFMALAGLASGIVCQTHLVVGPGRVEAADHRAAGHEHHGASHSNTPVPENADTCCVPRLADTPSSGSMDSIPQAVRMVLAVVEPGFLVRPDPTLAPTYKPPGWHPPLDQTSVLLI